MDCIRSRLRIWSNRGLLGCVVIILLSAHESLAAFASRFSLLVGEEYNDNIFFVKKKEHDFVTIITPTLTFLYAPTGATIPTLNLNISPSGQIYAHHSELNNFGDNIALNAAYGYQHSPRLSFQVTDSIQRLGETRTGGVGNQAFQLPNPPTTLPPITGAPPNSSSDQLRDFVSRGNEITNSFSLLGSFLYRPDMSFVAGYNNSYTRFIQAGGSDIFHNLSFRGVYNWRRDHNLHAGYSIAISKARNGSDNVAHNFDLGDDYFSNYQLQLTPTFSLSASTGLSLETGSGGVRVSNNSNLILTKLWETATLTGGVRKGLTPSFGISGISDTTSFFSNFFMLLTERLSATAGVDFSLFDTEDVNFKTFQASLGIQYAITSWLASNLTASHRWIEGGAGLSTSSLIDRGKVSGNLVILSLTASFDVWPNVGLARGMSSSTLTPVLRTPFPVTPTDSSSTPVPIP
jgi:hypothetical protein